jgi:hypothetical protein
VRSRGMADRPPPHSSIPSLGLILRLLLDPGNAQEVSIRTEED